MKVIVIGGGIGGFATALSLHAVGIACEVFEQARGIRELGVGINRLPHASQALAELGLLDALDRVALRTSELIYANRCGQAIWRERRGCEAGYDYPQFSLPRGTLPGALYEATRARIGQDHIHIAHQLHDVAQDAQGVTATFLRRAGSHATVTARGDGVIAADGMHATVRRLFSPGEGAPPWNGIMLWRGAVEHPPFLTGRSMRIAGGMQAKLVLSPLSHQTRTPGTTLLNWAVAARRGEGAAPPPRREDWHRLGRLADLLPHVEGVFHRSTVDPVEILRATPAFYEYPLCARAPLPHWSCGRVTLLGDAAPPLSPVGANGASQAILDARGVAPLLAKTGEAVPALQVYEAARRPGTAQIVQENRAGGPERVIDVVEERAPHGFAHLAEVASRAELAALVKGYSKMAGFDQTQVNGETVAQDQRAATSAMAQPLRLRADAKPNSSSSRPKGAGLS
jgi:2-polyprenyl-6-methoxyphenol hydroxylase-like FAD-dependent oxidoreductase